MEILVKWDDVRLLRNTNLGLDRGIGKNHDN